MTTAPDNGGITLKSGDGDKTWQWLNGTDSWTSSEHIRVPDGKVFGFAMIQTLILDGEVMIQSTFTTDGTEKVRIDISMVKLTIGLDDPQKLTVNGDTIMEMK